MQLENYIAGTWVAGSGKHAELLDASTGELIATTSSGGLDFAHMLHYARTVGGPPLRKMTFPERGRMLKALALYLMERKEEFYRISYKTGATKADSWVDIEGGIGNLFANASLRRVLGNMPFYVDGDAIKTSKGGTFIGHHIMVPKEGVAVHINAFNFPIWGMLEKVAVNWMAGVPAVVKPATVTSYLTEAMVKDIVASGIVPEGAIQLIVGSAEGLLDHVMHQDVVTFTGSASTGRMLKRHPRIVDESVPFNMEADSLNAIVLGPDATPGTEEFDLFIKEVGKEMTLKCGQRCTGARRILVPANVLEDVQIAIGKRLGGTVIGDPRVEGVRMGALAGQTQRNEVKRALDELLKGSQIVYGSADSVDVKGADAAKGAFMSPILLLNADPWKNQQSHNVEAFGPVSTLMPYTDIDDAVALTKLGKGSLCASIATYDEKVAQQFVWGAASHHGRMLILNREMAKENTGHGSPLATLVHGGPGRAGGGEEMGGKRGVMHYLQRTAIQGHPSMITAITQQYQQGARMNITEQPHLPHALRGTRCWRHGHYGYPPRDLAGHRGLRPPQRRQVLRAHGRQQPRGHHLHGARGARLLHPQPGCGVVRGSAQRSCAPELRLGGVPVREARVSGNDHSGQVYGQREGRSRETQSRRCCQGYCEVLGRCV